VEVFRNLADAQVRIEAWRKFYNQSRPHSSIGYLKPQQKRERSIDLKMAELGRPS
jgi:putative transposase